MTKAFTYFFIFLTSFLLVVSCERHEPSETAENTENTTETDPPENSESSEASEDTEVPETTEDSEDTEDPGTASEPENVLLVVKFTDDKYRNYILAENILTPVRMRGSVPPVVEELIVGTIPYSTKLSNGYWIVNWRWGTNFIYPPSNILLPDLWESLTHWNQTWEIPADPLPFNAYIADYGFVRRRIVDSLLSINEDVEKWSDMDYLLYESPGIWEQYVCEKDIPAQNKDRYFTIIHQQDSLHAIYVQRLIEITNNGDFKKVYISGDK